MNKIKIFFNIKGGVGKTTSVTNLALGLVRNNKKVLLIDLDYQGNTTDTYLKENEINNTITNYFLNEIKELPIYRTTLGVDIVPSDLELSMVGSKTNILHTKLKNGIKQIYESYDYILIDCNPYVTDLTYNALVSCDEVVIPIKIDNKALKGLTVTLKEIKAVNEAFEKQIQYKLLFTMFNRTKVENIQMESLKSEHPYYEQVIRTQNKFVVESSFKRNLVLDTNSGISNDYSNLVNEVKK